MNDMKSKHLFLFLFITVVTALNAFTLHQHEEEGFVSYTVDASKDDIQLYWKDNKGEILQSIQNLRSFVESGNATLVFAMNAGMYKEDHTPLGLFIQNKKTLARINTSNGHGNFYLKPNGIFYITTDHKAAVCKTESFSDAGNITFATQSGPMLVVDGKIHPAFVEGSKNLNIRNGVGILPDGNIVFAMSKTALNFYDFAAYFQKQGCVNALYLDGFVSRTYCPEKHWTQTDGDFGVIIGVVKKK